MLLEAKPEMRLMPAMPISNSLLLPPLLEPNAGPVDGATAAAAVVPSIVVVVVASAFVAIAAPPLDGAALSLLLEVSCTSTSSLWTFSSLVT